MYEPIDSSTHQRSFLQAASRPPSTARFIRVVFARRCFVTFRPRPCHRRLAGTFWVYLTTISPPLPEKGPDLVKVLLQLMKILSCLTVVVLPLSSVDVLHIWTQVARSLSLVLARGSHESCFVCFFVVGETNATRYWGYFGESAPLHASTIVRFRCSFTVGIYPCIHVLLLLGHT